MADPHISKYHILWEGIVTFFLNSSCRSTPKHSSIPFVLLETRRRKMNMLPISRNKLPAQQWSNSLSDVTFFALWVIMFEIIITLHLLLLVYILCVPAASQKPPRGRQVFANMCNPRLFQTYRRLHRFYLEQEPNRFPPFEPISIQMIS